MPRRRFSIADILDENFGKRPRVEEVPVPRDEEVPAPRVEEVPTPRVEEVPEPRAEEVPGPSGLQNGSGSGLYRQLGETETRAYNHLLATRCSSSFVFKIDQQADYVDLLKEIIKECVRKAIGHAESLGHTVGMIGVTIRSSQLTTPIHQTLTPQERFQPEIVVTQFAKIEQSASTPSLLGDSFTIVITTTADLIGGYSVISEGESDA